MAQAAALAAGGEGGSNDAQCYEGNRAPRGKARTTYEQPQANLLHLRGVAQATPRGAEGAERRLKPPRAALHVPGTRILPRGEGGLTSFPVSQQEPDGTAAEGRGLTTVAGGGMGH